MAALNKILVHVPSNLCDGFKTKYVTATTNRNTSYDNKVVFLEKTQEIFTKGKLYGTNIGDFNDLKALVGTIPSGATSTNIIDYINEKINSADHIHSVSKKSGETLIDVATSNKAVTVNSTSALTTAVSNANSAMQSVSFLGKTLNKTTNSITVKETKTALGLGSAAYKNTSDFDAAGAASTAAAGVEAKLPVVTNGSGITVTPTTDGNGKTTYTVSTSAEVFHYKGNKTALSELPSTGNTTGDVWSVGPANAVGSTLYAWDGDEWINIGGANGITGVDTTASSGVALAKNTNGTVKVNVTPGSVSSGNGSVVTGGAVYTAIAAAEERSDAKVLSTIKALDKPISYAYSMHNQYISTNNNGGNITLVYRETDGIVNIDYLEEYHAKAKYNPTTSTLENPYTEDAYFYVSNVGLVDGHTLGCLKQYVDDKTLQERNVAYNYVRDQISGKISSLDKPSSTANGTNVHVNYKEEDGIVTIESVTEDYAIVNVNYDYDGQDDVSNFFIKFNQNENDNLIRAYDLLTLSKSVSYYLNGGKYYDKINTYVISYIGSEGKSSDNYDNISFTYSQQSGIINISYIDVNYASLNNNNTYLDDGIVTGNVLNNVLENIWENYEG